MAWDPTIAELEVFLGGAHVLRTLSDPNRTGQTDRTIAQSYILSGAGMVRRRAEVKHDPETLASLDAESALVLSNDVNEFRLATFFQHLTQLRIEDDTNRRALEHSRQPAR